ncbi:hypothetical protein L3X38_022739 [Prunus dulcis]|uniref:Uncharacterized protein n=1 Tax=Prunus dulcis TaxID=3755 RepID=A0AAD4VWK1_PRUDU|nr:hypothetical protein L3X38_022739 [Prunus dulcis]
MSGKNQLARDWQSAFQSDLTLRSSENIQAKYSCNLNPFIPYLAIYYLDRFFLIQARYSVANAVVTSLEKHSCPEADKYGTMEVEEAFAFWGTPEGDPVHPAECMQQTLEKVRRHRVNVDGNV